MPSSRVLANACKNGIAQQAAVGTAERRIGHQRHVMLLAPWQQVMFNAAVAEIVRNLIGGAAIAIGTWKRFSISLTLKFETPQARIFPANVNFQTPLLCRRIR